MGEKFRMLEYVGYFLQHARKMYPAEVGIFESRSPF
jgi:hypothetical protein